MSSESSESLPEPEVSTKTMSDLVAASLRDPAALRSLLAGGSGGSSTMLRLSLVIVGAMAFVGLLLATFSGGAQYIAVPVKVVAGTVAAMCVCLPSLFVFSNLAGGGIDLRQAIGSMTLSVAVLALVLLALAPVALIFSLSTDSEVVVGWIHVIFLGVAAWFGGGALNSLWTSEGETKSAAGVWMMLFLVVLLQLSTTFRPLVGKYEPVNLEEKRIFIEHWFGEDDVVEIE